MPADSFESSLTLAACGGHIQLAHLLMERGANIEEVNDEGYTPLMEASREGHISMVKLLLRLPITDPSVANADTLVLNTKVPAANVNVQTEETMETALTLACCGGFKEVAEVLVDQGAPVWRWGQHAPHGGQPGRARVPGGVPPGQGCQRGCLVLHQGRPVLHQGRPVLHQGRPVLHQGLLSYTCENGHTQVVTLLLNKGVHIEQESEGGRTPLMKTARAGHFSTVQYLVNRGADVNRTTTDNDHTPLSLSCAGGHVKVVDLLLSQGPTLCTSCGTT